MADKPFRILPTPTKAPNATLQTQTVGIVPKKGDPAVNEELTNETPDHPPRIPWPAAKPLEQDALPMKLRK